MGGSRSRSNKKRIGKSSQNSPIIVLIFVGSMPCVFCLYVFVLLKVVSHDDLSVLSVHVRDGFQKKHLDRVVGKLYPFCC